MPSCQDYGYTSAQATWASHYIYVLAIRRVRYVPCVMALLKLGGLALISTLYHGYLKNLALAVSGRLPAHMDPFWEGGHIKSFTVDSLTRLLISAGFVEVRVQYAGRWLPSLAKSMVVTARRSTS